ncbi:MAG: aminoacetone oxidase family FAD-binding enzyme [Candidatus Omnitrophica bacterium]|nr:aminoacetone oxidase family FAD-binding enzyme [Candidatus Omnitrophota bacterium]
MQEFSTAIVGAGAAGLAAAISAKRRGTSCVVCERLPKIGKKILASGNGRCNLSNEDLSAGNYNEGSKGLVTSVFGKFGSSAIKDFFHGLGLELVSEDNRIFPATNQSSSVLKALELEIEKLEVPIELGFTVERIESGNKGFFVVSASGKRISCSSVVITGGGNSYPALGSDGSAYKLASSLGHTIVPPVPSAVPLMVKDPLCHLAQGQRIEAKVKAMISKEVVAQSCGDLMFTKYGFSGTAILDISRNVSIALNRQPSKSVYLEVDIVPFIGEDELASNIERAARDGRPHEDVLAGVLPLKISAALKWLISVGNPAIIAKKLKSMRFEVIGTRGWNEAEFTAGGVDALEVDPVTLGSKIKKGIYFAGEVLDVDGRRGGYNLAWAWASGFVAGTAVPR